MKKSIWSQSLTLPTAPTHAIDFAGSVIASSNGTKFNSKSLLTFRKVDWRCLLRLPWTSSSLWTNVGSDSMVRQIFIFKASISLQKVHIDYTHKSELNASPPMKLDSKWSPVEIALLPIHVQWSSIRNWTQIIYCLSVHFLSLSFALREQVQSSKHYL